MIGILRKDEIAAARWGDFCRAFSAQHRGWITTVAVIETGLLEDVDSSPHVESRVVAGESRLHRLGLQVSDGGRSIVILVRSDTGWGVHRVEDPRRVLFEETEDGAHKGLRIDGGNGESTVLRFRVAAKPEQMDGFAPLQ